MSYIVHSPQVVLKHLDELENLSEHIAGAFRNDIKTTRKRAWKEFDAGCNSQTKINFDTAYDFNTIGFDLCGLIEQLRDAKKKHSRILSLGFSSDDAYEYVTRHPIMWVHSSFMPFVTESVREARISRSDPTNNHTDKLGKWFGEFGPVDFITGEDFLDLGLTAFGDTIEEIYEMMALNLAMSYTWDGVFVKERKTFLTRQRFSQWMHETDDETILKTFKEVE